MLRVRRLLEQSQYARALAAAQTLLVELPGNRAVLYMTAIAQRYLEQIPSALETLAELEKHHPEYGRLYQERGHCYVALRSPAPAIEAFLRAVTLNASLPASWRALQALYKMSGHPAYADDAGRHLANLATLPAEILTAFSMFADGEIDDAERVVRQFLQLQPDHVEGLRLLAQIATKLDAAADAERLLKRVLTLAPQHRVARYEYVLALLSREKHAEALTTIDSLLQDEPNNLGYRITHAAIRAGMNDYDRALPLYRSLLADAPRDAELLLSLGQCLATLGRTGDAIDSYRSAVALRPEFGAAYWNLANLKIYRFTGAEVAGMRSTEESTVTRRDDRFHLCFALGKAFEDAGDYAQSFTYYERGNALKKSECRYRPERGERTARRQEAMCTREFFAKRRGFGAPDAAPVFIVGLPRSGSTLVEQILASHSRVEGTHELANIPRLAQDLQDRESRDAEPNYPGVLAALTAVECRRLGKQYLADTRVYRNGKPVFLDKMPNNFLHLGLIHLILPNARIIDIRREPMACCFSNFKQLFAHGQEFTYSMDDLARYYRMYVRLMAHWDAVLPGKVLRVDYAALVDNLDSSIRRLLDFCGLAFEHACVNFHKTERRVHTPSAAQVRRPIDRQGLNQWRHYADWLVPLRSALGELVTEASPG